MVVGWSDDGVDEAGHNTEQYTHREGRLNHSPKPSQPGSFVGGHFGKVLLVLLLPVAGGGSGGDDDDDGGSDGGGSDDDGVATAVARPAKVNISVLC
ncbi:unnamed protein product [Enterobius vermicularis]|uniref:Uncharacterized protein n=1 Tax=Enterobius vermicularis TaxID=51028 RepID=A0A0N4VPI2_ENTVE|nr:unnamed protein product [Enterobius vermicularis]